jgi:hypothetical protein
LLFDIKFSLFSLKKRSGRIIAKYISAFSPVCRQAGWLKIFDFDAVLKNKKVSLTEKV